jgi:hypothetical protein
VREFFEKIVTSSAPEKGMITLTAQEPDAKSGRRLVRPEFRDAGITVEILDGLDKAGFVIVPREPLACMVEKAYWAAHDESAEGVWHEMIEEWESALSL